MFEYHDSKTIVGSLASYVKETQGVSNEIIKLAIVNTNNQINVKKGLREIVDELNCVLLSKEGKTLDSKQIEELSIDYIQNAGDILVPDYYEYRDYNGVIRLAVDIEDGNFKFSIDNNGDQVDPSIPLFDYLERSSKWDSKLKYTLVGGDRDGLATTKEDVEKLGGTAGYEPFHKGSRFWYQVPLENLLK